MSELIAFGQLGVRHILDINALDHVIFLIALAAIYRFRDARNVLWVVTAFTVGHSITLALAVTGVFGLVHGAGFANYLKALFVDDLAAPLFGFNLGIEIGQVAVLVATGVLFAGVDRGLSALRLSSQQWPALRVRVVAVSLLVVSVGSAWAVERSPW